MSIWTKLKSLLPPWVVTTPAWQRVLGQGRYRPQDYTALVARYESWVYKCATTTASAAAAVPLRLYVHGGSKRFPTKALNSRQCIHLKAADADTKELLAHPLLDLLSDANPMQTGGELRELVTLHQELTGNAYWYIERGTLKVPKAVWPMMPQATTIVPGDTGIAAYLYGSEPDRVSYPAEDVIQFRYPNPADSFYGLGPLQAAIRAVDRSQAMAEYQQEFFDNSARMDFALTFPAGTPDAERERVLKWWAEKYSGKGKRHLPGYLVGDMDLKTFQFAPADAALIEASKLSREEIAGIFGIPMTMLENSLARAEAESQQWAYATYTLTPRLRRMESTLNERLVPMYDDSGRLFLAYDDVVPENVEQEIKADDTYLRNYATTVNEVRAHRGQPPVAWGDMPLVIATGMPIGTEPPPGTFGPVAREIYCPMCKTHHKAMPPMTSAETQLKRLAEGWWAGMREETLGRMEARR